MLVVDRSGVVSSFTVIKGALVPETYEAFRHWDLSEDRRSNISRLKDANVFGARSSNWIRDLGKVLNRRFDPETRDRPLIRMAQNGVDLAIWTPALLWHMTRDEFLVRDFLIHWLMPRFTEGVYRIQAEDVLPYLTGIEEQGLTQDGEPWSAQTRKRVASGLLGIAQDVGLLRGGSRKEFASHHLREEAFLYLLHALSEGEAHGGAVIHSSEWRMYLYQPSDVEQELLRLHQFRKLHYQRAGSVVSLTLPFAGLAEYAESLHG